MTENDIAWERTFEKYFVLDQINQNGFVDLTATELKVFREPRLMAKIDHAHNLPAIFRANRLSILPISKDGYRIGPFKTFQPLRTSFGLRTQFFPFPNEIQTMDIKKLTSESAALQAAYLAKILDDFSGEKLTMTTSGRMRSGTFSFQIDRIDSSTSRIEVHGVQIEIDAGYEGQRSLLLFEAKNHRAVDFNVRQLYYPFRTWRNKVTKEIRTIFLTFERDEFNLFEFSFGEIENYSSIILEKVQSYSILDNRVSELELIELAKRGQGTPPRIHAPFPQADKFERVIDLVAVLIESPRVTRDLTTYYEFDERQTKYYLDAARYLDLVERRKTAEAEIYWIATPLAKGIFRLSSVKRDIQLAALLLNIDSLATTFLEWVSTGNQPSKERIEEILRRSRDSQEYSGSTIPRRASTLRSWTSWVKKLAK